MGRRRRSQKKIVSKKRATVSKVFKCPFCSTEDSVQCKMDSARGLGILTCTVCAAKYQTAKINYLTEPIDVFCEWLDACEDENAEGDDDDEDDS